MPGKSYSLGYILTCNKRGHRSSHSAINGPLMIHIMIDHTMMGDEDHWTHPPLDGPGLYHRRAACSCLARQPCPSVLLMKSIIVAPWIWWWALPKTLPTRKSDMAAGGLRPCHNKPGSSLISRHNLLLMFVAGSCSSAVNIPWCLHPLV